VLELITALLAITCKSILMDQQQQIILTQLFGVMGLVFLLLETATPI
jgi:hypothetical protein